MNITINIEKSQELYNEALRYLPAGVNSPVRAFRQVGGTPIFIKEAKGCYIIDVDDNEYLDFCNSWGAIISGHRHEKIIQAIKEQAQHALTLGIPNPLEVEIARKLVDRIQKKVPSLQKIRFVNSGTEAVMSAIRLARGYTKRNKIIKFEGCYHGHVDSLLVKAGSGLATFGQPSSAGIPTSFSEHTIVLPLDDEDAIRKTFEKYPDDIACVIIEPIPANHGLLLQRREYLEFLREITKEYQSVLIFDEVISGLRVNYEGAAGYYHIEPDLLTYGKILGGGLPVGAFGGRKEIFDLISPDGPVYQAGTLSGNPLAMAAGIAQLELLTEEFYQDLEEKGRYLEENLKKIFMEKSLPFRVVRIASIFWIYVGENPPRRADQVSSESMKIYAKFFHHCLQHNVYLAPSGYEVGFLNSAMTYADLDKFLEVVRKFYV
ncbi:MAG: glutamate-1-semialdehyde 2,1-aminomutase [Leptospiraceae bacterium]|nr:glutamate-1-semialdehyde 2,1-aminomutase [Leptospiraceae bacterium]MDW7975568.1 glutamate-1-semialdehyde 2,1-aminomutase [Leptospiraceae bacterium]